MLEVPVFNRINFGEIACVFAIVLPGIYWIFIALPNAVGVIGMSVVVLVAVGD
jgi:hypothetical protein